MLSLSIVCAVLPDACCTAVLIQCCANSAAQRFGQISQGGTQPAHGGSFFPELGATRWSNFVPWTLFAYPEAWAVSKRSPVLFVCSHRRFEQVSQCTVVPSSSKA